MKSIILSANKRFNTVDGPVLILIIIVVFKCLFHPNESVLVWMNFNR